MRLHRWILAVASRLVPKPLRTEWRAEWDAELHHRESSLRRWNRWDRQGRMDLVRRSAGALWDALWLQSSHWYSLRLFARHWRLSLTALLSLGAGIAATVVGLAASNALLLRPPGVTDPRSLLTVHVRTESEPYGPVSFDEYTYYRTNTQAFSDVVAFPHSVSTIAFRADDRDQQVVATEVSGNYFSVLGVRPHLGHLIFPTASPADADDVVLSQAFWRRLGANPRTVGSIVRLNDHPVRVIGVAPATFGRMLFIWEPDVWMPFKTAERVLGAPPRMLTDRTERWLHMVGRLKPGMSESQARVDLQGLSSRIEQDHPETDKGRSAILTATTVVPAGDRAWVSLVSASLFIIVLLVLIVACANVTNLLLGLSTSRRHEMLVRAALGASRLQLAVPLLRESTLLALVAGALGYGAAHAALVKLSLLEAEFGSVFPSFPPPSVDLRPDVVVMAGTLAVVIVAGIAVGMAPAWRAASDGVSGALNREVSAREPRMGRIRNVLVVMQMTVATLAMVGVGVSIQSLKNLERVSLGFSARNLVFTGVDMRRSGYDERTGRQFYERIRQRLAQMPDIDAVSLVDGPAMGNGFGREYVVAEHDTLPPRTRGAETRFSVVDDRYFSTLGISLLAGRTFAADDRIRNPEVVVINATMARRHWAGRDPVGQRLRIENGNRLMQVIGVVADGKYDDVEEPQLPFMYFALGQHYLADIVVIARTRDARPAPDMVARALLATEPNVIFGGLGLMTLDRLLAMQLFLPRAIVVTVIGFGALTLALAIVGLYSTVFYSVSQRRHEMGIRVALGAQPRDLFMIVLGQTARVASLGATLGVAAGSASLPLVTSLFYGIRPVEPMVVAAVACASVAVALVTAYLAARPWTRMSALDMVLR
jgi:predicted permease